ncbi:hypothetical protein H6768_01705 [Candidatus Peribacteria bacterium]|nr:hypothetical protein [Candidatus Peribacteria bacterium]
MEGEEKEEAESEFLNENYKLTELKDEIVVAADELSKFNTRLKELLSVMINSPEDPVIAEIKDLRDKKIPEKEAEMKNLRDKIEKQETLVQNMEITRNRAVMDIVNKYIPKHQELETKIAEVKSKIDTSEKHIAELQGQNE